jgi:3-deoxy-manno-octulosonate cytidylyltransferase (CMP-KDO synthetase)
VKVLGVIPARMGATRFPGKPLALLRGRPLDEHVLRRARAFDALDRVVVATADDGIARVVEDAGGEAIRTRSDHASGTDRVAEVSAMPAFSAYGAIVNVQGDEPLIDPRAIALAALPVARGEAMMATLAHAETDPDQYASPDVVRVRIDAAGDALEFARGPHADALPPEGFLRHVGLYVYERATLARLTALPATEAERSARLEQLRALGHGIKIRVVLTPYQSRGVDTPADLAALERDWDTLHESPVSGKEPLR